MITRFGLFFSLALILGGCSQAAPKLDKSVTVDCSHFAGWTEIEAFWTDKTHKTCGHPGLNGVLHISPETMKLFKPDYFERNNGELVSKELTCLTFSLSDGTGGFGYLAADGRARISNYPYDNDCQPFRNDVAISYVDGKAVFFDANLNAVKQTNFVLADPFYKHLAKVCSDLPKKEFGPHNEHFAWVGGQCGYIDTDFNVVVPIEYAYENAPRLTGGKYDGVELNQWDMRTLNFFLANLESNASPIEAVFGVSGCKLNACTAARKEKLGIPTGLPEDKTWLKTMRFRLEDQTLWEGQAFYKNNRVLMLHSLYQIDSLPAE